jgi:peptidoglycan hydrolase-like protein with peptidoglycan-binding domain
MLTRSRLRTMGVLLTTFALMAGCAEAADPTTTITPSSSTCTTTPESTTSTASTTTTTTTTTTTSTTSTTTTTTPPATTTTQAPTTTITRATTTTTTPSSLKIGDQGPAVLALQVRLRELRYWLANPDGIFGNNTHHAVVALQKTAGLEPDGVVGPATEDALDRGVQPRPKAGSGRRIEIVRDRQVLLLVQDGTLEWTFDTSTGRSGFTTPIGQFAIYAQLDGTDPTGAYRPKYFYRDGDLAIHGYPSVPPYPFSHGCARVTINAMDWLWAHGNVPIGTPVWVYSK